MSTRARACGWRSRRGAIVALATVAGIGVLAGCGSSSFPNKPRAAAPIELTASMGPKAVKVSPQKVGAGLARITIANLSSNPASFRLRGPTSATSDPIAPNSPTILQEELRQGTYTASAIGTGLRPTTFKVGPPRPSSQNKLLLP
jgi:hypothetical protein